MYKVLPKSKLQVQSRGGLAGIGVCEMTSQWWDGVWATEPGIRQLFQGVAFILKAQKDKSKLIGIVRTSLQATPSCSNRSAFGSGRKRLPLVQKKIRDLG